MRYIKFFMSFVIILGFGITGISSSQAQTLGNLYLGMQQPRQAYVEDALLVIRKGALLEQALEKFEKRFDVVFLYEGRSVKNKKTSTLLKLTDNVDGALQELLKEHGLTYKMLNPRTYGIYPIANILGQEVLQPEHTVSGTVVDADMGVTMPGVNILVKGTSMGTVTDLDGAYSLSVPSATDTLVFSFIGYATQEVPIQGRRVIDVALQPATLAGEEIVVVGYGNTSREDLTGSVSSVSAEEMKNSITSSFDQSLQGKVAGVMIMRNSGRPGAGVSVQIRGVNTLNSNSEPLYVIDGVPLSGDSDGITNPLATINPTNIQSIDILKDASAAAIYGSRASNGVVIITTKRGYAGETNIDYDAYVGIQQLPKKVEVMNLRQYAQYSNKRAEVVGWGAQPELADLSILGEGTDWQEALFNTAPMTKHNLSVSGGSDKTQYMLSAGYFNQEGIAVASNFERYSFRLNLDSQPATWADVGTSLSLSRTDESINVSEDNIINLAIRQSPNIPVKYPDGSWGGPTQSEFTLENPVALAKLNTNDRMRSQVIGNFYADLDILDNLTLRNELNGTFGFTNDYLFNPTYKFNARVNSLNSSTRRTSNTTFWQIKNYLTYIDSYQQLEVNAMAGHEVSVSSWEMLWGYRERFPSNSVTELRAGDPSTALNDGDANSHSLQSVFGRVKLNYNDRYLLTGTLRTDGSSNFTEEKRWGVFPSVSAAWRISNEVFMENVDVVSELKLRAGYGFVGNQNVGGYLYGDVLDVTSTQWGNGIKPSVLGNPTLQWESTESINIGMDIGLLNHRINLIVDVYIKRTHDLLLDVPLPLYVGTSGTSSIAAPVDNIGSLENKGLEFALNTINTTGELRWESDIVLSVNRNEVTELNSEGSFLDRQINFFDTATRTAIGEPVGQFYGYVVEGIFADGEDIEQHATQNDAVNPTAGVWVGDLKFKDLNNDGVIDNKDRTFIGNPMPDFQYGITNRFFYKNFDLSVFINGSYGNKIFNQIKRQNEDPASDFNMLASVFSYARIGLKDPSGSETDINNVYVTNPETTVPRITSSDPNNNQRISDRFVEDGTYLRIQNITLGYSLPVDLLSKLKLRDFRVYASVQNLYTFTGYSGYDPEIGSLTSDPLLMGIDLGRYPSPRIFTFGISLGL